VPSWYLCFSSNSFWLDLNASTVSISEMNTVKSPVMAIDLGWKAVLDDAGLYIYIKGEEGLANTNEQNNK